MDTLTSGVFTILDTCAYSLGLKKKELPVKVEQVIASVNTMALRHAGSSFVRLAGLSGAVAVGFGAYGAHAFRDKENDLKVVFDSGNKYHLLHTLALLAVPHTGKPKLTGTLLICGMVLFSGTCYYHALTGDARLRRLTPYGGMLLIAAWLSMIL